MVPRNVASCPVQPGGAALTPLKFWKTESTGNDFVLVNRDDVAGLEPGAQAVRLCRRNFGIGADGLLVVGRDASGLTLDMYNADGTPDFCGNGLRCAGLHAWLEGWVGERFEILHLGRSVPVVVDEGRIAIELPAASFAPKDVPATRELVDAEVCGYRGSAVSTGSTHYVVPVLSLPEDQEFFRVGPLIEHAPEFPERTSVMFTCETGPQQLAIRIWERGVGETLGCGTGSVAAAVVWARLTGHSGVYDVQNPGGPVRVSFDDWRGPVVSETSPSRVFAGTVELAVRAESACGAHLA